MKKTISIIILLIFILFILSGCVKVDYTIKINEDGRGEITYIYGMDKTVIKNMGKTKETATNDKRLEAEKAGYSIEPYEDENIAGFKATKKVEDITEKSVLLEIFDGEYIKNKEDSKINIKKYLFGKIYEQNATIDLTEMKDMKELGVVIKYSIQIPTRVGKTNANFISEDRRTISWDLKLGETQEISFSANSRSNFSMDSYCFNIYSYNNSSNLYFK